MSGRIARVQASDGGTYTCVASNRAGVDNKHYNLQVYGETAVIFGFRKAKFCHIVTIFEAINNKLLKRTPGLITCIGICVFFNAAWLLNAQFPLVWMEQAVPMM